jgi:DNA-directed RNA polymerase specialized sigma24 family protein
MDELLRYMRAMVMLQLHNAQLQSLQNNAIPLRAEVLLADAGFSAREISEMLSKSPAAVAKAISRGRAVRRGSGEPALTAEVPDV